MRFKAHDRAVPSIEFDVYSHVLEPDTKYFVEVLRWRHVPPTVLMFTMDEFPFDEPDFIIAKYPGITPIRDCRYGLHPVKFVENRYRGGPTLCLAGDYDEPFAGSLYDADILFSKRTNDVHCSADAGQFERFLGEHLPGTYQFALRSALLHACNINDRPGLSN